ncbi:MOSC domain-containing protein [Radicibacter daui]|uniref:MOSC domain-containing protein n=1 Tax=Radicibacter daui TaxID=3064829 RepID=UPI004046BC32
MGASIEAIFRYPIKGMTAQSLESAELEAEAGIAGDRRFALAHARSACEPEQPTHQRKSHFLQLMRNAPLANLRLSMADGHTATVAVDGHVRVEADLETPEGRAALEDFMLAYIDEDMTYGGVRVVDARDGAEGLVLTDQSKPFLSLINKASVSEVEVFAGRPVDPMRFRGNLLIEGIGAWEEASWIGRNLTVGECEFEIVKAIDRCAATEVDPTTAERDIKMLSVLKDNFGNIDCGIFARVVKGGRIAPGDVLVLS